MSIKTGVDFSSYREYVDDLDAPDRVKKYFKSILKTVEKEYKIAVSARNKKIDPSDHPESEFTWDMAERIEKMFKLKGLAKLIRENAQKMSREKLALYVVDELLQGRFGMFSTEKFLDIGSRLALAILTEGMTVAPIEGIKEIKIKDSPQGPYPAIYFSGPIRSAGGTEAGLVVVYVDYIRRKLGLNRYIALELPGDNEVARYIEELRMYERNVGRFQYTVSDEDVAYAIRNITVEITGVATDDVEVVMNRDLSRVETNKVRGGALRVLNDGIIGRARKIYAVIDSLGLDGWEWLKHFIKEKKEESSEEIFENGKENGENNKNNNAKEEKDKVAEEVIVGRPVFSLKGNKASFRIRYGRESNMGISAVGVHPAIYPLLDYFIVIGSQIKVNLPGKGAITVPSSICDPPVVELNNGSVIRLKSEKEARRYIGRIKRILWLGDILISYGDFLENNYPLVRSPYVEEWWYQDLLEAEAKVPLDKKTKIKIPSNPFDPISFDEALELSKLFDIPLHPKYTLRWNRIQIEDLTYFLNTLLNASFRKKAIVLGYEKRIVELLKELLVEFRVKDNKIVIQSELTDLFIYLSEKWDELISSGNVDISKVTSSIDLIQKLLGVQLRDVEGETISARLGRPEKVKPRETSPPIHILFPIGKYGGSQRNLIKASDSQRHVVVNLSIRYCPTCQVYTYKKYCEKCGSKTEQHRYCTRCKVITIHEECPKCKRKTMYTKPWTIDLKEELQKKSEQLRLGLPPIIKGVEGLLNKEGLCEDLAKGFIRAFRGIYIFKDGTTRIDVTNAPLHHFTVKDIHITVEQARKLGYKVRKEDDVVELYPQDIIIPYAAAKHLVKIANYLDDLLVRVYGLKPYYNVRKVDDLLGKLVVGLSPHTSVGIIGRIIGFTNASVLYAHPLWHAAKRRDCDGDEDAIMFLLDVLINFSKAYLPSSSGGRMDAPLFINIVLHPEEVDTQVHNMDIEIVYPKEFYELTLENASPKLIKSNNIISVVENILGSGKKFYGYSSLGYPGQLELKVNISKYTTLNTMQKKLDKQMRVMNMIFDEDDIKRVVRAILTKHILPDIIGNLRAFSSQMFRCKKCGRSYRRPPLNGRCTKCGGEISQTVHPKNVIKYLDIGRRLVKYIKEDHYLVSRFEILEKEISQTIAGVSRQKLKLTDFLG